MIGGFDPGRGWEFFFSPPCPDLLWNLPSVLFNGYKLPFSWGLGGRSVNMTSHLHPVELYLHSLIRLYGVVLS